jgi:hypothetical protein
MKPYVSIDKRSKKAQKEYYSRQRRTWGELKPATRSVPSGKVYNRKKDKRRIGVESRNGFDADFILPFFISEDGTLISVSVWGNNDIVHPARGILFIKN